ncbi:hypothetical protein C0J52_06075 [Blattella germanica]|nr:hypothetical protein C0J52_06075 [Blattella germanica]
MVCMVALGLVLSGFVERSATVALLALSDPLSSAEFAEYVANTSYVTRYCASINETEQADVGGLEDADEDEDQGVPFSEEEDLDFRLREVFLWGTLIAPLPSSRLAAKAGPVRVFGIGVLGAGALAVLVPFGACGCDPATPAALYTAAVVISGATAAGAYASAVDIAPNFAGSWRLVFGVAAFVLAATATTFMAIGSGSVQPWNSDGAPTPEQPSPEATAGEEATEEAEPTTSAEDAEDSTDGNASLKANSANVTLTTAV